MWIAYAGTAPEDVRLLPCPIRWLTSVPCPGCGISRASVALASGRPGAAFALHPAVFVLLPLAVVTWLWPKRLATAWGTLPRRWQRAFVAAALVALVARWVALVV